MSDPIERLNAALEGRYRTDRELGEGGMATVYLADDLKHERKVALKVLKPALARDCRHSCHLRVLGRRVREWTAVRRRGAAGGACGGGERRGEPTERDRWYRHWCQAGSRFRR